MKWFKIIYLLLLFIAFSSCEKLIIQADPPNTRLGNFDLLWKTLDEKYSYFTYKNIDWNALRDKYRPKAAVAKTETELFGVMADMLYELKDGHVNLTSYFDISRNWEWYLDYPANFDYNVLERNYLGNNYQIAGPLDVATINEVGYIYYGSFQYDISSSVIDNILYQFKKQKVKGIIIDVRDNGGGSLGTADFLVQHFLTKSTVIGYTKYKSGSGHDDFTEYYPTTLSPTGETFTDQKIIVLTNRKVFSAANYFVSAMSQLPNVVIVGDQTGGGGGAPITAELQDGWRVRYSATQQFNASKQHLEPGVVPTVKLDISSVDQANGKDTILETALSLF